MEKATTSRKRSHDQGAPKAKRSKDDNEPQELFIYKHRRYFNRSYYAIDLNELCTEENKALITEVLDFFDKKLTAIDEDDKLATNAYNELDGKLKDDTKHQRISWHKKPAIHRHCLVYMARQLKLISGIPVLKPMFICNTNYSNKYVRINNYIDCHKKLLQYGHRAFNAFETACKLITEPSERPVLDNLLDGCPQLKQKFNEWKREKTDHSYIVKGVDCASNTGATFNLSQHIRELETRSSNSFNHNPSTSAFHSYTVQLPDVVPESVNKPSTNIQQVHGTSERIALLQTFVNNASVSKLNPNLLELL